MKLKYCSFQYACMSIRAGLGTHLSAAALASEILNEVVVEALKHADRLHSPEVTKAWLLGIAANLIKRKRAALFKRNHREPLVRDLYHNTNQDALSDDELFDQFAALRHGQSRRKNSRPTNRWRQSYRVWRKLIEKLFSLPSCMK